MGLRLDLSLVFVPKSISEFLGEISTVKNSSEKSSMLDDYITRLEEELRKIDAFKRELPLCMLLLNDAIGRLKEEGMQCREEKDRAVIEEFIPLKGNRNSGEDGGANMENDFTDKKNWMSSAQLWSTDTKISVSEGQLRGEEDDRSVPENPIQAWSNRNREGAFVPFNSKLTMKEDKEISVSPVPSLSLMTPLPELNSVKTKTQTQPQQQPMQNQMTRKQRRCWSPELHRRFIDALQQLGGAQAATPKQIREFMQVDGLTNDEVKSHLQKYRLHVRKVPGSSAGNGLWMDQDQCGEHSKPNTCQSGSPQGPLHASGPAKGLFSIGGDSMEAEEDENSDGHSWKGLHKPVEDV